MSKCDICKTEIKEGLIGKINGTYLRVGKKVFKTCCNCQRIYTIDELKKKVK
ncbi:MAG: hypothetical protein PHN56_05550 [Candidatus Nanoarchaeia archaeon]|nr:hypothetical protein [Candidatus Nanoarchaeia archaeon]